MKHQIVLVLSFLFFFGIASSQTIDNLVNQYNNANYFEAMKLGEKLIDKKSKNPEVYFITGDSYQQLNKFKLAEKNLQTAYLSDSLNLKYINAYAYICSKNFNIDKAINLYNKVLKIDSLNFNALNNVSKLYETNNQYNNAIKAYMSLSKQDSLNPYYYRKIAWCFYKLKDGISGLDYYMKAYKTDSTDVLNIQVLADYLYTGKKYNEAIEFCNKGIGIDSLYSDFYKIKANVFFAKNHYYLAVPQYKKAIELGDSSYNVKKRLGMALCETKQYKEALTYNLEAYKTDSNSYSNTSYLSRNYLGLGENDKCIEFADKTLMLIRFAKRIEFNSIDNKALAYTNKNDYQSALKMYDEKYKVFDVRYVNDNLSIAILYDKLGNKKTALVYYEKVAEYKKKYSISLEEDKEYQYVNQRITRILEDLHFEGN